jgi:prephenate dehydratase
MSITVGFQGSEGSFTNKAATNFFGDIPDSSPIEYSSVATCKRIFEQVEGGILSYGVIPVESSSHGTMPMYLEALLKHSENVRIVGETIEREHHCLCAHAGATEATISRIISHPIILEDCSVFIAVLEARSGTPIEQVPVTDSAAACRQLCAEVANTPPSASSAALCTREAAALYGLTVLSQSVGNDRNSETRYIIIASADTASSTSDMMNKISKLKRSPNEKVKGSLTLSIKNSPGSMFKMISCFSLRDFNILKIESRPASAAIGLNGSAGSSVFRHWDMVFFIDYEVSENEANNSALWANLREYCDWARPLGEYNQSGQQQDDITVTDAADWDSMLDIVATA